MDNKVTVTISKARFDELLRFEKPITSKRDDKRGAVVFILGGQK